MEKKPENLFSSTSDKFLDLWLDLENYQSPYAQAVGDPGEIIFPLIKKKSIQSAFISFGAGSIPGVGGILSIFPETYILLKLQARMIKDIAILLGRESFLSKEILLYCLFKDSKLNLLESSIRITGTKLLVRPISFELITFSCLLFFFTVLLLISLMILHFKRIFIRTLFAPILMRLISQNYNIQI
ncbi:MAG: hypothetical protein EBS19_09595 [Spirochaetia bacterium]|nr:hypothetical protein [Spirochaetia bacterium]